MSALAFVLVSRCERPEEPAPPPPPPPSSAAARARPTIAALGRLEPRHGVIRVAGPPRWAVVIGKLHIEEGDEIQKGQVIAHLADIELLRAQMKRLEAELALAEQKLARKKRLSERKITPQSEFEDAAVERDAARASLEVARADLDLSIVRSPIAGRVLEIHAREGGAWERKALPRSARSPPCTPSPKSTRTTSRA